MYSTESMLGTFDFLDLSAHCLPLTIFGPSTALSCARVFTNGSFSPCKSCSVSGVSPAMVSPISAIAPPVSFLARWLTHRSAALFEPLLDPAPQAPSIWRSATCVGSRHRARAPRPSHRDSCGELLRTQIPLRVLQRHASAFRA